ncbi:MAG TPA: hypothetical protein VFF37_06670, partial [Streptomyces sp.]|nr:hypothetical protein [Streptomyces sp.]
LYYRMTIPSGGIVCARVAGEGDPVQLTIPDVGYMSRNVLESEIWSLGNTGTIRVQVPRDVAWALWAALSDALMPGTDALPDWALELIEPTDEQGQPLPGLPAQWPF